MNVGFEEKTYESYFNTELDRKSSIYFPFGQVQEGVIGSDSASNSHNKHLWHILGYPFLNYSGVDLKEIAEEMQNIVGTIVRGIPTMKVNLFFQYKRPQYITLQTGKEWKYWNKSYYRYSIYKKQHKLLVHLEKKFGSKALILYAAPAIYTIDELVKLKKQQKIIDNSNFKKISTFSKHSKITYTAAGTSSIALSEPEEIDDINIIELLGRQEISHNLENKALIIDTQKNIFEIISTSKEYSSAYNSLMEEYSEIKEYKLLYSFLSMKAFSELTGIQWLIKI